MLELIDSNSTFVNEAIHNVNVSLVSIEFHKTKALEFKSLLEQVDAIYN